MPEPHAQAVWLQAHWATTEGIKPLGTNILVQVKVDVAARLVFPASVA